jgi:hypothetical protein
VGPCCICVPHVCTLPASRGSHTNHTTLFARARHAPTPPATDRWPSNSQLATECFVQVCIWCSQPSKRVLQCTGLPTRAWVLRLQEKAAQHNPSTTYKPQPVRQENCTSTYIDWRNRHIGELCLLTGDRNCLQHPDMCVLGCTSVTATHVEVCARVRPRVLQCCCFHGGTVRSLSTQRDAGSGCTAQLL